jgi:hypothetical protein
VTEITRETRLDDEVSDINELLESHVRAFNGRLIIKQFSIRKVYKI